MYNTHKLQYSVSLISTLYDFTVYQTRFGIDLELITPSQGFSPSSNHIVTLPLFQIHSQHFFGLTYN